MKKKLFLGILFFTVFTAVFSSPKVNVPKNTESQKEVNVLSYCDDNLEFNYTLTSVASGTVFYLKFTKQSLSTNVKMEIVCNFNNEEDLDAFVNDFFNRSYYSDISEDFIRLKNFYINLGAKPLYITGDNDSIERILYIVNLHKD